MNAALNLTDTAVTALSEVCHVVEVKAPYVLVHAAPLALVAIMGLGYSVTKAKRGGDYYAVKIGQLTKAEKTTIAAPQPAAPVVSKPKPANDLVPQIGRSFALNIKGETYDVTETNCKRKVDVRRWECAKPDGSAPYIVTFQDHSGLSTACSCKGGIFHKHCKHMDAIRSMFGAQAKSA